MQQVNKDGQAIGRKGAQSRTRLLEAAARLLRLAPAEKLTASAIARAAGLASQSFYVYFDDVDEILLWLSRAASDDIAEIVAELDRPWDVGAIGKHAERVVAAFYRHWDRHRAILNLRNFRADSGQESFAALRNASALPIIAKMAARIRAAQGGAGLTERDAIARAVLIFAAIERMASRYAGDLADNSMVGSEDFKRAEADILALLFSPPSRARAASAEPAA